MTPDTAPPLTLLGSLLFTLMGPIAVIPAFAAATAAADRRLKTRIALRAVAFATAALVIAVFLGASALAKAGAAPSSLIMAAGLLLVLTAVRTLLADKPGSAGEAATPAPPPLSVALSPLAIPRMVTPVGVAILVTFVSYFPEPQHKLAIMAVVILILLANGVAMLFADWFMRTVGMTPLIILGSVFGVIQTAMGIEMILSGLARSRILG